MDVTKPLVADLAVVDAVEAAGTRVIVVVPANERGPPGLAKRVASSPTSARTRAPRTGPSPGAEVRVGARWCPLNVTPRTFSSSATAACIATTMAIRW